MYYRYLMSIVDGLLKEGVLVHLLDVWHDISKVRKKKITHQDVRSNNLDDLFSHFPQNTFLFFQRSVRVARYIYFLVWPQTHEWEKKKCPPPSSTSKKYTKYCENWPWNLPHFPPRTFQKVSLSPGLVFFCQNHFFWTLKRSCNPSCWDCWVQIDGKWCRTLRSMTCSICLYLLHTMCMFQIIEKGIVIEKKEKNEKTFFSLLFNVLCFLPCFTPTTFWQHLMLVATLGLDFSWACAL